MSLLICLDRDGTINKDDGTYYLGKDENWKDQIEILPGVVEGIKRLNSLEDSYVCITTNQAGVAITNEEFKDFTLGRMHEVRDHIISILEEQGAKVDNYYSCSTVDGAYAAKSAERGRTLNPHYVITQNNNMWKPGIGMVKMAARDAGYNLRKSEVYAIGDRLTDALMGIRAGGTGIMISECGDSGIEELIREHGDRARVAKDFLSAVDIVCAEK